MGCVYVLAGTIRARNCAEVQEILERFQDGSSSLGAIEVKEDKEELEIVINLCEHCSYGHASAVDDIVQEFGPFVIECARLHTECDDSRDYLYVGNEEQVRQAKSNTALESIREMAVDIQESDIENAFWAINSLVQRSSVKKEYFRLTGEVCPFCKNQDLQKFTFEREGLTGIENVHCSRCRRSWRDVYILMNLEEDE